MCKWGTPAVRLLVDENRGTDDEAEGRRQHSGFQAAAPSSQKNYSHEGEEGNPVMQSIGQCQSQTERITSSFLRIRDVGTSSCSQPVFGPDEWRRKKAVWTENHPKNGAVVVILTNVV
jgi:hypothetical protein